MKSRFLILALACFAAGVARGDVPKAASPFGIEDQPIGRVVSVGGHVTLSITVTGAPPSSYQWFKGSQAVVNNARISGATTNVLNIDPVQVADTSNYFAVATSSGGVSATSSVVSVLVQNIPIANTPVGTNVIVNVLGSIGEVYRIEFSSNFFFVNFSTNGYATNRTGVAEFVDTQGPQGSYRARFERMLPVLYPPSATNVPPVLRAYGKLNQGWRFEATTNFVTWTNLATITNTTGWVKLIDSNAHPSGRFYRISPP